MVLVPWAKSEMRIPRVDARKALEQDARVNRVCLGRGWWVLDVRCFEVR